VLIIPHALNVVIFLYVQLRAITSPPLKQVKQTTLIYARTAWQALEWWISCLYLMVTQQILQFDFLYQKCQHLSLINDQTYLHIDKAVGDYHNAKKSIISHVVA
jgi:hypothetical protein